MTAKRGLEPQTALVLADLDGPQARQIADMTPEEARAHIDAFVEKWDLDPKPAVGAVEDFEIPGPRDAPAIPVRLYRPVRPAAPGGLPLIVFFVVIQNQMVEVAIPRVMFQTMLKRVERLQLTSDTG